VTSDASLYNLMAREWQFTTYWNNGQYSFDRIETSSSAVIHLIDKPLKMK